MSAVESGGTGIIGAAGGSRVSFAFLGQPQESFDPGPIRVDGDDGTGDGGHEGLEDEAPRSRIQVGETRPLGVDPNRRGASGAQPDPKGWPAIQSRRRSDWYQFTDL